MNFSICLTDQALADIDAKRKRNDEINIRVAHFFYIILTVESVIQDE